MLGPMTRRRSAFAWTTRFRPLCLLLAASTGLATAQATTQEPPSRPNLVFLYTDDHAAWAMGASGDRDAVTPALDRLAREGARFPNAFTTTPVCSPSRAGMLTSRYSTQVGIADWINPTNEPEIGLPPAEITWPELLKAFGYRTALFGKWHQGTAPRFHPTRQGFESFFGFLGGGNTPMNPTLEVGGVERKLLGSLPDLLVDGALDWLANQRRHHPATPFLLAVHFREPHAPYAPVPTEDSKPFLDKTLAIPDVAGLDRDKVQRLRRDYYGSVHAFDRNIGRILEALDRMDLTARTIVIYTSDHGYMIGEHGLHHKGNASWLLPGKSGPRPNMFDDAIRVPLLVRWPGVVAAGSRVEQVVSNLDLMPTVLELVGLGIPPSLRLEGRSFASLLRGLSSPRDWDDSLFGQYDMHHYTTARMRMIRTPEWKLIRHFEPNAADELYHLKSDAGELVNRAASTDADDRAEFQRLNQRLTTWMKSIGDPLTALP